MALFTQEQCDNIQNVYRERRGSDWIIVLFDENGTSYRYIDSATAGNATIATHITKIHTYLKANCEFKVPSQEPDSPITVVK